MWSLYVIESESYIIKISFELRALFSCYDHEKKKKNKEIKDYIMNLWELTTSHIRSMSHETCCKLTNIVLVISANNRK